MHSNRYKHKNILSIRPQDFSVVALENVVVRKTSIFRHHTNVNVTVSALLMVKNVAGPADGEYQFEIVRPNGYSSRVCRA
jgi:hypothetical protein